MTILMVIRLLSEILILNILIDHIRFQIENNKT